MTDGIKHGLADGSFVKGGKVSEGLRGVFPEAVLIDVEEIVAGAVAAVFSLGGGGVFIRLFDAGHFMELLH
jgi:hypothetical protein